MPLHPPPPSHSAHPYRVQKSAIRPRQTLGRTASLPLSTLPRTKPHRHRLRRTSTVGEDGQKEEGDMGSSTETTNLLTPAPVVGVLDAIRHTQRTMFTDLPERGIRMRSTQITRLLHYRRRLPPLASCAHVHGVLGRQRRGHVSTQIEREMAALLATGQIRKIRLVGHGKEASDDGLGATEFLVLTADLERMVREDRSIESTTADNFLHHLHRIRQPPSTPVLTQSNPRQDYINTDAAALSTAEITTLRNAGFLISPSLTTTTHPSPFASLSLSLPNTGSYLSLLTSARSHLVHLLTLTTAAKTAHALPLSLLRERWEGGQDAIAQSPAPTINGALKKWKLLHGLDFEWILTECLGAGLVELFHTASVGLVVRLL